MSSLGTYLRELAPDGLRIHIWPCAGGGYQINVAERGVNAWTVVHDSDAAAGLSEALRQKACGIATRVVEAHDEFCDAPPEDDQIDLEEAIAATETEPSVEDMLG